MVLTRVIYLDYVDHSDLIVRLAGRNEHGERVNEYVRGTSPFLFVPSNENIPDHPDIVEAVPGFESYDGKPLTKLKLTHPQATEDVKADFSESYESDIPYYRRMALEGLVGYVDIPDRGGTKHISEIDTDPEITEPISPRVMVGDLEVLPSDGGQSISDMVEAGRQPVIAATFWDSYDDEYRIFVLDPDDEADQYGIKYYLDQHWGDEYFEDYVQTEKQLVQCSSEMAVWQCIVRYIQEKRPDITCGWNWVDFDWEYLLNWGNNMGKKSGGILSHHDLSDLGNVSGYETQRKVDGLPAFDLMDAMCEKMTWTNWRSKALDYVSTEELGVGKVDDIDIQDAYENEINRLVAYNIIDTQLCVALERKHEIIDFFLTLADQSSIPIYDTFSELRLVDGYIMSRREDDEILPEASDKELDANAGALVLEASEGIEDWVGVFDVKSLYPSAIISCNISPETQGGGDVIIPDMPEHADDVHGKITQDDIDWQDPMDTYGLDQEGIVPKYIRQIFEKRDSFKAERDQFEPGTDEYDKFDTRQYAIKVIMNSFYGVMSSDYWRLAFPGGGDAVTGAGRYILWYGVQLMREEGYDVLAGDTDSVMAGFFKDSVKPFEGGQDIFDMALERGEAVEFLLNDGMNEVASNIGVEGTHPYLAGTGLHGTDRHCFVWEFEKLYKRFLMGGSKKRYAGNIVWKEGKETDDVDIVGFEYRRSDVPEIVEDVQKDVITMVLSGEDFNTVSDRIRGAIDDVKNDFSVKLHGLPSVINQPIDEYPNRPIKRAVPYSNEHLGYDWTVGDRLWLVPVVRTPPGYPPTDYIALDWYDDVPDGFEVNTSHIITRAFKSPLLPIITQAGYSWREVRTGNKTSGIGGW